LQLILLDKGAKGLETTAKAHTEKRLFISLLTRDISLADAFLDLIDNSINAAIKQTDVVVQRPEDFFAFLSGSHSPKFLVEIHIDNQRITIKDNCGGISTKEAQDEVFVFGASDNDDRTGDKLSVYGIGLKRALFKLGNNINIVSDHRTGGFELALNVPVWAADKAQPWTFPIRSREPNQNAGTEIVVSSLHDPVISRMSDPAFLSGLHTRISRAYSYFISRIVSITLNGTDVQQTEFEMGENRAADSFESDNVAISIIAGIGVPKNKNYTAELAGWNVFCNGRAVIFFDKSELTGWGVDGLLPSFQPKHRPFLGVVFFYSSDPEKLPWTTTKLGVNQDNENWQTALPRMAAVGRQVTRFLDERYKEEGTTITTEELKETFGISNPVNPIGRTQPVLFKVPTVSRKTTTSIQYQVNLDQLSRVKSAIGKRHMSNSDVGRYTFDYFVENEI
jgi:Histidine kinase-, DNA gyrase B-, and HSP90-like ATPase